MTDLEKGVLKMIGNYKLILERAPLVPSISVVGELGKSCRNILRCESGFKEKAWFGRRKETILVHIRNKSTFLEKSVATHVL